MKVEVDYSKERLDEALEIFREEHQRSLALVEVEALVRKNYPVRRTRKHQVNHATAWDEADASSDEYLPETPKKLRAAVPRTPAPKPKLAKKPESQLDPKIPSNPRHTRLNDPRDIGPCPTLVTLKIRSAGGKTLLNSLAGSYGTGYEKKDDGKPKRKSYFALQEEEIRKIAGTTRSGLKRRAVPPAAYIRGTRKAAGYGNDSDGDDEKDDSQPFKKAKLTRDRYSSTPPPFLFATRPSLPLPSAPAFQSTTHQTTPSSLTITPPTGGRPIDELRRIYRKHQESEGNPLYSAGNSSHNPITLGDDSPSPTPTPTPLQRTSTPAVPANPAFPFRAVSISSQSQAQSQEASSAAAFTFTITTPWAHPINFKHLSKNIPCDFCTDFRFGVYGYGLLEVEVFRENPDDIELQEAGNGHRSAGYPATKMCVHCALARLCISRCKHHLLVRFGASDEGAILHAYVMQLTDARFPREGPKIPSGVYETCSLCAQPAFHRCRANQTHDRVGAKLSFVQGQGKGCGLKLCENCAGNLEATDGVLKVTTVRKKGGQPSNRRADMGFLFPGSMLHRAYK